LLAVSKIEPQPFTVEVHTSRSSFIVAHSIAVIHRWRALTCAGLYLPVWARVAAVTVIVIELLAVKDEASRSSERGCSRIVAETIPPCNVRHALTITRSDVQIVAAEAIAAVPVVLAAVHIDSVHHIRSITHTVPDKLRPGAHRPIA